MTSHHQHGETNMALPMNDDFSNRELSLGELEVVAGGLMMRPIPNDPKIPPKVLPGPTPHPRWVLPWQLPLRFV
jgi:hypothetical protein